MSEATLTIVTGVSQSGKTTWLRRRIDEWGEQGRRVDGVITPAVFEGGRKMGIDAVLLPQKETLTFARLRDPDSYRSGGAEHRHRRDDIGTPQNTWDFPDETMAAINRHLATYAQAFASGAVPPGSVLVVDELGPLELIHKQGFTEALDILDARHYHAALLAIRPALIAPAQERWGEAEIIDLGASR